MHIPPFATEQFFARYEFNTPHLLCASDCESMSVEELLEMAGDSYDQLGAVQLAYTESQGLPALREQVAGLYDQVDADGVVMLGAPEEGIFLLMHTLLEAGDEVVVLTPAYDSLRHLVAHVAGADKVRNWSLQATEDGWELDMDRLESLLTPQTKLLVVNFPHNPTGYLPDQETLRAIVGLCRQHDIWLFCDEMYRGLELDGRETLPSAADLYEKAIVLSGLSKTHGLPGLRCGWLLMSDPALRERLINWKHYTTICAPAPIEFLAGVALTVESELSQRNRQIVAANLALAEPFFQRHRDFFSWRRPQAGSVALVEVAVESADAYCRQLAEEAGVLLLPGTCLGAPANTVRFGFGRRSFGEGLAAYEVYLEGGGTPRSLV